MPTLIQKQIEQHTDGICQACRPKLACLIEHYEEDIRELEGKRQYVKYEENEMPEEEKILFVKIFGECKTPEYMVERRIGFNSALSLAISLLQDKIKQLKQ